MTQQTNVCITIDYFPIEGGKRSVVIECLRSLEKRFNVQILTMPPKTYTDNFPIISLCPFTIIQALVNPFIVPFNLLYVVVGVLRLTWLNKKYHFKAILAQDGVLTGLYSTIFGKICKVPIILMDYGAVANYYDRDYWNTNRYFILSKIHIFLLRGVAYLAINLATKFADIIMIGGNELEKIYCEILKVPRYKCVLHSYGVDTSIFQPVEEINKHKLQKKWRVPRDARIITITSRLAPQKGFEYIFPALEKLINSPETAKNIVLIAGEGPLENYISTYINEHKLNNSIFMLGSVSRDDMPSLLQISDIYLYAGTSGGFISIGLLEAMACCCAVIATNSPKAHENLINGENGILIPIKSENAIHNALIYLNKNVAVRKRMGEKARETILRDYSLKNFDTLVETMFQPHRLHLHEKSEK